MIILFFFLPFLFLLPFDRQHIIGKGNVYILRVQTGYLSFYDKLISSLCQIERRELKAKMKIRNYEIEGEVKKKIYLGPNSDFLLAIG